MSAPDPRAPRWIAVLGFAIVLAVTPPGAGTVARAAAGPAGADGSAAGAPPSGPVRPAVSLGWPLPGRPPVLRRFEPPPGPYAPGHRGVDLGAAIGTPVRAAAAGVVGFAAPLAGRGVVTVLHAGGLRTTYEPVIAGVRTGAAVTRGQLIGSLAAPTGHCGPGTSCLHWGLLRGSTYLDPLGLLGIPRVRLYPPSSPPARELPAPASGAAPAGRSPPGTTPTPAGLRPTPPTAAANAPGPGTGAVPTRTALAVALALGAATTLALQLRR